MRVILGCDPLLASLTGIGNYTQQLGLGLLEHNKVKELALFAHGKFYNHELLFDAKVSDEPQNVNRGIFAGLRSNLARSSIAVSLYSKLIPIIERHALRNKADYVFHSPNFLLPNHCGKRIVTIHDLSTMVHPEFHPPSRVNLVNNAIEHSVKYADHIITDSEFIKRQICEGFGLSSKRVTAIHLGVSKDYHPRTKEQCTQVLSTYGLKYKDFLLFVSTIEPRKNILCMLKAYSLYREKHPNGLPLILIGGTGWNSEKEHKLIKSLEHRGWVKYLGYVRQLHVPILYAGSKGLIFPSLYEGFGLPVAEAIQSGVPVITSKNSAMSEFSDNNCLLIEPFDIVEFSSKIKELSESNFVIRPKKFDWGKTINKTLSTYKN